MAGVDELIVAAAFEVQMAGGLDLARRLVVCDLVGSDDVIAVIDLDFAGQRPHVAALALLPGSDLDRNALVDRRNYLGNWNLVLRARFGLRAIALWSALRAISRRGETGWSTSAL